MDNICRRDRAENVERLHALLRNAQRSKIDLLKEEPPHSYDSRLQDAIEKERDLELKDIEEHISFYRSELRACMQQKEQT